MTHQFQLYSSHSLSLFLLSPFFFGGHFLGIILVGKVFGKGFRIVGLDEESFFLGIFGSRLHFLLLSPDFLTESTSGLKNLFPLLNCSS